MSFLSDLPQEVLRVIGSHIWDPFQLTQRNHLDPDTIFEDQMRDRNQRTLDDEETSHSDSDSEAGEDRPDYCIDSDDRRSLLAFALTCRAALSAVQPLLHRVAVIRDPASTVELLQSDYVGCVCFLYISMWNTYGDHFMAGMSHLHRLLRALPNLRHLAFEYHGFDDCFVEQVFEGDCRSPSPASSRASSVSLDIPGPGEDIPPRHSAQPDLDPTLAPMVRCLASLHFLGLSPRYVPQALLRAALSLDTLTLEYAEHDMTAGPLVGLLEALGARRGARPLRLKVWTDWGEVPRWPELLPHLAACNVQALFLGTRTWWTPAPHSDDAFVAALAPLAALPLRIAQVAVHETTRAGQRKIATRLAALVPSLLAVGIATRPQNTRGIAPSSYDWFGISRYVDRVGRSKTSVRQLPDGGLRKLEGSARAPAAATAC